MEDENMTISINSNKEAALMFTSFLETKDRVFFDSFMKYISGLKYGSIPLSVIDINELLYKVDGKTLLEILLNNYKLFDYNFKKYLSNNIVALKESVRLGKKDVLKNIDEETLLRRDENGVLMFDYLLDNSHDLDVVVSRIKTKGDCIKKFIAKDRILLSYLGSDVFFNSTIDGQLTIDYLFQNKVISEKEIKKISDSRIYETCLKYNRYDLLPFLNEDVLKSKRGDKTIFEILIEQKIYPKKRSFFNVELLRIVVKHRLFNYLVEMFESSLLTKYDDNNTILDFLLENGYTPIYAFYSKKESMDIFLKHKRYDLMAFAGIKCLNMMHDLNRTYLDYLLEEKKKGLNFNLSKVSTFKIDAKDLANFYISVAKHGFIKHVLIKEENLLENNGELLKELLNIDKDLTMNVILSKLEKENVDIAILLRMNGIEQKNVKVDLHSMDVVEDYYENFNSEYRNIEVNEEGRALINEFRTLMLSDNKSDPKMVEAVITSYTYLIASNNEYGLRELRKLIEIKKNKPKFSIKYNKGGSFFQGYTNSVNLENICLNTLNHEMGHALFFNLTDREIPSEYEQIIHEIRSDPRTLEKIRNYSMKHQEIVGKVETLVDEKYMKNYHISEEERKKIENFLSKKKEDIKKEYLKNNYDESTIDTILSEIYSIDEYIEQDKRIKREELIDAILRSEYGAFLSIGDIIDSIYDGKFRSGELFVKDSKIIPTFGHGIAYYNRGLEWCFDENMADYSGIIKSVDGKEAMAYLKEIVGERFVTLIDNYYRYQISLSTKDLSQKEENTL